MARGGAFTLAAALAYYAIFAIAPLLLISIYLASFFLDRSAAVEGLTNEMIGVIGSSGSDAIKEMLDAAGTAQPRRLGRACRNRRSAICRHRLRRRASGRYRQNMGCTGACGWHLGFHKDEAFFITLVLAAAFLLLISLVLSTAMTALTGRFTTILGLPEGIVQAVVLTVNFLLTASIFAAIFKFVPSVAVTWRAAIAGGVFTALLFALGRFVLAWYLSEAEASAYGAATSLVLLLIWVYYLAQILFLGAQFSQTFQNEGLWRGADDFAH